MMAIPIQSRRPNIEAITQPRPGSESVIILFLFRYFTEQLGRLAVKGEGGRDGEDDEAGFVILDLDGYFGVAMLDGFDEGIGELVELSLGE
jgi:hypothetical protein